MVGLYDDRPEESLTPRLSQRYDVGFASRASASASQCAA